jgi:hypothetical protein
MVDRHNVRVLECGGGLRFAAKASDCIGIARGVRWKKLDGDAAPQGRVLGHVHLAHAALAEPRDDAIRINGSSNHLPLDYRPGGELTSVVEPPWRPRKRNALQPSLAAGHFRFHRGS